MYYRIGLPQCGDAYFEQAIEHSENRDQTLLHSARSILAHNPRSEEAIAMLKQITEQSPRYAQALDIVTLNMSAKDYFEMVAVSTENTLQDTEMLNRALYHKIANEISILKSIVQRIIYVSVAKDVVLEQIVAHIEDILDAISQRRVAQQSQVDRMDASDYEQIVATIAQTAHDISDFVNNELAVIESRVRRTMRTMPSDAPNFAKFHKLLDQLEFTQSALNDLKSINEGITIRKTRFRVQKLFEKWQESSQVGHATISLDIRNGESVFNGDEEKIKSALNELVENALKHNANKQDLKIHMYSDDVTNPPRIRGFFIPGQKTYLFIQFRDNGIGIPEDKKDWIFQPLTTTSEEGKGSGLGMFIIRRTLREMGGYIVETGIQGARFELYIPYTGS